MNRLQISLLLSNQITQIKFGQDLARNASAFRNQFKKAVGLGRNATHLQVLIAIGQVYKDNKIEAEFHEKLAKFQVSHLVTAEMLK